MMKNCKYGTLLYRERPVYHHPRMETAHRAKQFAPFAALKGFEESVQNQTELITQEWEKRG